MKKIQVSTNGFVVTNIVRLPPDTNVVAPEGHIYLDYDPRAEIGGTVRFIDDEPVYDPAPDLSTEEMRRLVLDEVEREEVERVVPERDQAAAVTYALAALLRSLDVRGLPVEDRDRIEECLAQFDKINAIRQTGDEMRANLPATKKEIRDKARWRTGER